MIVLSSSEVAACLDRRSPVVRLQFAVREDEDVFNALRVPAADKSVSGTVRVVNHVGSVEPEKLGASADRVHVIATVVDQTADARLCVSVGDQRVAFRGFTRSGKTWQESPVQVVPVREQLFDRHHGLIESDRMADKSVAVFGLGSGGIPIPIELTKSGVMRHGLVDHDRLEVGNVSRHFAGLSQVGRFKTRVARDAILEKNPFAEVHTWEIRAEWSNFDLVREIVRNHDLTICAIDEREGRRVINRACVEESKPGIFGAAFRRAYGGQILVLTPGVSPCYECFLRLLPEKDGDQEVSNSNRHSAVAYSDRPVAVEPGLSTDIAPISLMATKIALQLLLKGIPSALHSLDDDLVAPWYLWINRREEGSDYERLEPLEFNIDGLRVLRWYGVDVERDPACPVCGDFAGKLTDESGIHVADVDLQKFRELQSDGK